MSPRPLLRGAAIAAATTALIAASAAAPAVAKGHSQPEGPSDINGYRSVGYLMADSPVTRDFQNRIENFLDAHLRQPDPAR